MEFVFGVGPADGHLAACESCSRRLDVFRQRHQARPILDPEVPSDLLADQRRAIYSRLTHTKSRKFRSGWVPIPVAALVLGIALFAIFRPGQVQTPSGDAISEDKALQEVFAAASGTAPTGLKPVKFLFEVKQ